jgi:hypothetical protein
MRALRDRGVGGDLLGGRRDGTSGQQPEARVPAAHAHGQLRRTDAASSLGGEEALDDAVLERVVAQDHKAAARTQQVDRCGESGLERLELLVDRHAQRLEHARRGMRPARLARIRRADALDEHGELLGGLDRRLAPRVDDGPRDASRLRLLAVAAEQGSQLVRVEGGQQLRCGNAPARVEAHVERTAGPEPEPALCVGELEAG